MTREEIEAVERMARGMREAIFWRGEANQDEIETWAGALEELVAPYYPEDPSP